MRLASVCSIVAMGCSGGSATGTAKLLNGATEAGTSLRVKPGVRPVAENGCWLLSPNTLTVTLTHIQLDGEGADVSCPVTYDRSKPGLAELGDCAFSIKAGTYTHIAVSLDSSITTLVDDSVNGFYSTASGVVTTPPAGGAQPFTYTHAGAGGGSPIQLPQPLTISDGEQVQIDVVINALQSEYVTVNGGAVTPGCPPGYPDLGIPDIVATADVAKIKFYVPQSLNTAGSFCYGGGCSSSPPPFGISGVFAYYTSATSVAMVGMRLNGTPTNCGPIGAASFINDPRGYVGLDSTGTVGWAIADKDWSPYTGELAMPMTAAVGSTTSLYCKLISTDPMPAGGSFASGAPAIQTASNSLGTYTLVAE